MQNSKESVKRIAIVIAVIASATLMWWASHEWLTTPGRFSEPVVWVLPGIAAVIMGSIVALAFIVLPARSEWLAATLGSWATLILFWRPDIWYLTVLPLFMFFWNEAWRRVKSDLSDRRKIRINASLGSGMKMVLLGAFLMISLGYFLLPSTRGFNVTEFSSGLQQQVSESYENPIVQSQLAADQFPEAYHQKVREDLLKRVDDLVRQWVGPYSKFIPPLLAFVLFLSLWSVAFIFREFAIWLGVLLFALLKATGFIRIETEQVPHEVVRL